MKIINRKIIGVLFFMVALLPTYKIYGAGIAIDTRFDRPGGPTADVDKARIYSTTQTFTSLNDYAIGTVEFRNGLVPDASDRFIKLGVTPPIHGIIGMGPSRVGHNYSIQSYGILSDLTLGGVFLSGSSSGWNPHFDFLNTATLYLESDLILTNSNSMNFHFDTTNAPGTIDGRGNKLEILAGAVVDCVMAPNSALQFKDIKILSQNIVGLLPGGGPALIMRDVELIAQMGQTAFFYNEYEFIGTRNIFGYSGSIVFANTNLHIAAQSRVTIAPGTTIIVGPASDTYNSPPIVFTDATSELFLDNCTIDFSPQVFGTPTAGTFNFTNGTIYINGNVNLVSVNGLGSYQFGDGVNAANNVNIIILPGSKLIIGSGVELINANVS